MGSFGDVKTERDCNANAFTLAASPARDGTSMKVFNDGTKPCAEPNGEMKHRTEIQWGAKTSYSELNKPYWFGFSMFIPKDFPTKAQNSDSDIVAQWIGGSYGPKLSFQITAGEQLAVRRDWSAN
ncbi:heparin lyase I family protein [Thiogranum longum]|uniref:heparin lyase I family protein n=1 Tax=Thiogranum longum TaxID=1537524 RepID=UPI002436A712|nr:heparin lyase I family protein [Thiogranum longum]